MLISKRWIALEWSFSQKCFHIEEVYRAIQTNISCYVRGGTCDYVLLGIFESDKEASDFADLLKKRTEKEIMQSPEWQTEYNQYLDELNRRGDEDSAGIPS